MVSLLLSLVANKRLMMYVGIIVAVCLGLWLVRFDGYRDGVHDTTQKYEERIRQEKDRLEEANRSALAESQRRVNALLTIIQNRNEEINELRTQAEKDPSASDGALSADSVRRINRIR